MLYRQLGVTDIEVSVVGMGCRQLSTRHGNEWGNSDLQESLDAVAAALDAGINLFDTAESYDGGGSEEILGRALDGRRHQAVVATKFDAAHSDPHALRRALDGSLMRLGTDYVDILQMHFPHADMRLEDTMATLRDLRDEGKIRSAGVCNFGASLLKEVRGHWHVQTNQLPYSLLWRAIEHDAMSLSGDLGLNVLAYSPLAQGLLSGLWRRVEDVPPDRRLTRLFSSRRGGAHGEQGCEELVFRAIDQIASLCDSIGMAMPQVALAWVLARPDITAAIVGGHNIRQVQRNAAAADIVLPDAVIRQLSAITEPVKQAIGANADMWEHRSRLEHPAAA
jgi:aryl-alcohol dehydrogenase-like predicted oxidoreductase